MIASLRPRFVPAMLEKKLKGALTMFPWREPKILLSLTSQEARIILHSLIRLKNALLREGGYGDGVDEIILKLTAFN